MSRSFTASLHEDGTAEIIIFDDIGASMFGEGVTAASVQKQLKVFGDVEQITVRINSPGGAVFDGLAIYNLLAQHPARIVVEIDGLAASAASVIAMAGDEINIASNALMMLHEAQGAVKGDAADLRDRARIMDTLSSNMIDVYTARTGQDRATIAKLVKAETWLTAAEALELGLVTNITPDKAIAAKATEWLTARAEITTVRPSGNNTNTNQGTQMSIVNALGYADEKELSQAFGEIKAFQNGVVSALGAPSPADAVRCLHELVAKAGKVDALQAQVTAATVAADAATVEAQIKELDEAKKLAPSMQDWFRSLDTKAQAEYVAQAPALVGGSVTAAERTPESSVVLTAEDEMFIKTLSNDDAEAAVSIRADFITTRAAEKGIS